MSLLILRSAYLVYDFSINCHWVSVERYYTSAVIVAPRLNAHCCVHKPDVVLMGGFLCFCVTRYLSSLLDRWISCREIHVLIFYELSSSAAFLGGLFIISLASQQIFSSGLSSMFRVSYLVWASIASVSHLAVSHLVRRFEPFFTEVVFS